jgi:hypothetical protein
MSANTPSATETLHRLLFRALLEMRARGHEQKDKVTFHLADLFHNIVLEMENAARGRCSYEEVLAKLSERADEKGLTRWLEANLSALEAQAQHLPPTASVG